MGKMKKMLLTAMITALVVFVTACGRVDDGNTASDSYRESDPAVMQTTTESDGESGGVLRDVVDDVERGVDDVMDDGFGTGENENAGNIGSTGATGNLGTGAGVNAVE